MKIDLKTLCYHLGFENMTAFIGKNSPAVEHIRLKGNGRKEKDTIYIEAVESSSGQVVSLSLGEDRIEIYRHGLAEVFNAVSDITDAYESWDRQLQSDETQKDGAQKILEHALDYLEGGFYVYTTTGKAFSAASKVVMEKDHFWEFIASMDDYAYERLQELERRIDFAGFNEVTGPIIRKEKTGGNIYVHLPIEVGNVINYAHLIYFCYEERLFPNTDIVLARVAAHLGSCFDNYRSTGPSKRSIEIMKSIINGHDTLSKEVTDYFNEIQWQQTDRYQCLCVSCSEQERDFKLTKAYRLFCDYFPSAIACVDGTTLQGLINTRGISNYGSKLRSLLSELSSEYVCGISNPFHYLVSVRLYCTQAEKEMERAIDEGVDRSFAKDHELDYFRDLLTEKPLNESYINRNLLNLVNHDMRYGTKYYATVRAYITAFYHISDASRLLGIHRNTLLFRLDQIRQLIDFSEFDAAYQNKDIEQLCSFHISISIIDQLLYQREMRIKNSGRL
ncbi:MAG: helix-turn-helix domain-containing protein [Firmicutes bacterium]|nr:helix-turn-helix domain-containing protein [Bacillota bacterium]